MKVRRTQVFGAIAAVAFVGFTLVAVRATLAQELSPEEDLHVHRLKSGETSPYDAFAYLNRVAGAPLEGETPEVYAGNVIFSRLSNIEGRIQLKVVKGFGKSEYLGYKSFLRAWPDEEGTAVGNCVVCHTPSSFGGTDAKPAPSLRNLKKSNEDLKKIVEKKIELAKKAKAGDASVDPAYKLLVLNDADVDNLVAFLKGLDEIPHDDFRQIIVDATILDTSDFHTL